jgi:hypothetical protein
VVVWGSYLNHADGLFALDANTANDA